MKVSIKSIKAIPLICDFETWRINVNGKSHIITTNIEDKENGRLLFCKLDDDNNVVECGRAESIMKLVEMLESGDLVW